jgi:hypothetical protein
LCTAGDVADDELAFGGEAERSSDDHVHFEDRLGCEPVLVSTPGDGQLLVQVLEMIDAQSAQRDVADRWCDVVLDEPGVPVCGGGSDLASFAWHPRLVQKRRDGDRPAGRRLLVASCEFEASTNGFGFVAVVADRMPWSALLSGERVEAVVGDDVEAIFALDDVAHR